MDEVTKCSGDAQAAINAGAAIAGLQSFGGRPFVVVPTGYTVQDLSHMRHAPLRAHETIEALSLASFLHYLKLFGEPKKSVVFADPRANALRAVLDYHGRSEAAWCEHGLSYVCPLSLEWQAWQKKSGQMLPLAEFADHVERYLPDIVAPDGDTVLEISRGLTGKKDVKFTTTKRLEDGSFQVAYEENVSAARANGNHKVPPTLTLGLRPYIGSEPCQLEARLRYRVTDGGALLIGYELIRPARVLETKFSELCAAVAAEGWTVLQAVRR